MSPLSPFRSRTSTLPHGTALLLALAWLPACSKASANARPAPAKPEPRVAIPSTPPAAAAVVQKDDLAGLFRAEAQHRPAGTVHTEDVLGAFEQAGVEVTAARQHLAKPFGAAYCAGAEAPPSVVFSICEYESPEAATAGRDASAKGLASIPNREIAQNGATTLTLREREHTGQSHALVERLKRTFSALKK